ncbi:hypothetical protein [Xanthobacter autotrophicus]|uniref:hypothetical protein n=1 Tax=Xanthobacter autotrophicus TaxID=280 RepID=UPI0024A67917|nr:hypothetical protein [Xanthobacter autotrophicus]MDI4658323.1 hypothetical protein [Xanthobacter autotrophicus]
MGFAARTLRARRRCGVVRFMLPLALSVAGLSPAGATGSLNCSIDDKAIAFEAQAVFSHGLASDFSNFRAELNATAKDAPPAFAKVEMDGAALAHHWFHGNELRLHLYQERTEAPFGSLELVLRTRSRDADETAFAGRYELRLFVAGVDGGKDFERTYKGRATCSAG